MSARRKDIRAILIRIAESKYQKIISNIHEKRIKKDRTDLRAALMLGGIRRVK